MANETYISVSPKNEALKKYIAYYYFNASNEKDYIKQYIFYPHYRNAITVYKHSEIKFLGNQSFVSPTHHKDFEIIYTGIHLHSRTGKISAPFDKIGIVFQPLGINNFLSEALTEVVDSVNTSDFDYFGIDFEHILHQVYNTDAAEHKAAILDGFFVSKILPFQETRLIKAIELVFESCSVEEISKTLDINRKTLFRLFKKHINCSPKEFSNVVKFRNAINNYQIYKSSLTDLAYQNDYYDQSDFIKNFKKATGFNPKKFFGNLTHLGTEDTFWTLLNSK